MSNKINKDWQNFLANLTEDTEEKQMSSEQSSGKIVKMGSGCQQEYPDTRHLGLQKPLRVCLPVNLPAPALYI